MCKLCFVTIWVLATALLPGCSEDIDAPGDVAGFALGSSMDRYEDRLDMSTLLPVRRKQYLSEVRIRNVEGFNGGSIVVGNCAAPGQIMRIKMEYAYPDRQFYERMLGLYKARFGDPDEWRGDAFHTFIAWKWSFKDAGGNSISMMFQHGREEDDEHASGNVVKLTNWTLIEKERECYESKHPGYEEGEEPKPGEALNLKFPEDYMPLLPR